jgi:hypothetical protein
VVGRDPLVERLGAGAMGVVWSALGPRPRVLARGVAGELAAMNPMTRAIWIVVAACVVAVCGLRDPVVATGPRRRT